MTLHQFVACLEAVPPVTLAALTLLRAPSTPARATLSAAVLELSAYTQRCCACAERLETLPPVPLALPLVEWVL